MELKIDTKYGPYFFEPRVFKRGSVVKIDRVASKENLLIFRDIMLTEGVSFGLIYGTLLGAVRENNFIEHDEDTDLFMLMEDRQKLLDSLFILKDKGFNVGRYNHGELISIVRNGQYIDVYFFRKGLFKRKCDRNIIPAKYVEQTREYEFLGQQFNIPKATEKALIYLYGKDWKTPKRNAPATNYGFYLYIRNNIRKRSKTLFAMGKWVKARLPF